ncbi:V-type ATPase 116kDa subunit family protein [Rhodococcus sp. IEGM 1379]|uniref:V-type ATPase 116kDa subunit family protein n=1 Tax=Rhodococcus sp. IEGM 1379 TaxID=3047086 RepID=UPI0024B69AAE|nr:V-type ATPase 116kDa subunit family protein [Rhodococcus sp. IEGM 1379]MDI9914452.1 V-type ATPase 116kDa subunit family protein [Rhodococcus sp. IEGM 1379]
MQRVALVAPTASLRELLVCVANAGTVEIDVTADQSETVGRPAADTSATPMLAAVDPDLDSLQRDGRADLLAGESQLQTCRKAAIIRGEVAGLVGWMCAADVPSLRERLSVIGCGVAPLRSPRGLDPPTMLRSGSAVRQSFSTLVTTYATVPYRDLDPTLLAGFAYVVMFGMMFGDAGQGALLVVGGLLLRAGKPARASSLYSVWPFVVGGGLAAMLFGLLYGEFFGPTGVVPVLWIAPLDEPLTLLGAGVGVGAILLAGAYVVGTVNRWREGGWLLALSSASGIAGAALFAGLGLVVAGLTTDAAWLIAVGITVACSGVAMAFIGFLAAAGGGGAGVTQAVVEVFDAVVRVGTNLVSFARLAAFGLTHAALGAVVWDGTRNLWSAGGIGIAAATVLFFVGNAVTFALEALVAAVQALRLEYYELFSRVFANEGRPFRPWHIPVDTRPSGATAT